MGDPSDDRAVFVVHGRNEYARRSMFDFLRSIGLKPMEWNTVVASTGKASPYIGEVLDAAFDHASAVVVLLTPDEVAYLDPRYGDGDDDPDVRPAPQARPNVLFEAGMAIGRNPDRTVLVEVGSVRPFSDIAGRLVIRLTNEVAKRQIFASRLEVAGCAVDLNGVDWHESGDFGPPPVPGGGLPLGRRIPSASQGRPALDFDLNYQDRGGSRLGKLQVINRGVEVGFDVAVKFPEGAALSLSSDSEGVIPKIPGGGKYVTVDVFNANGTFGPRMDDAFDVEVTARTESGEDFRQEVFLNTNN